MVAVFGGVADAVRRRATLIDPRSFQSSLQLIRRITETDAFWVFLLVGLNVGFFGDALFTHKTFFVRDVSFFHYPLKRLVTEAYSQGHWPLWNPYIQLGQPLLANPNAMALYPTQILFQLLPFELAFDLHFVVHCVLAGIATFYLARALGASRHAAFLSAQIYNFSGVTLSFLNLFNILPVVALLPLLALALMAALRHFSLFRAAVASILFGVFFLLLEPLSSIAVALFLVPFLAWILAFLPEPKISLAKAIALVVIVLGSGLALAAAQILPTLELISYSGRKGGMEFDVVSFWSLHPISMLQVVFPRFFGEYFRLAEPPPWGNFFFDNREPYLLSCYFGFFPLLLACFGGLFLRGRWLGGLLLAISLLALLLALGRHGPVYLWLFHHVPVFRYGRYPVKFLVVINLCFSLLAGFGFDRLEELRIQLWRGPKKTFWALLLFGFFVVGLLCLSLAISFEKTFSWLKPLEIGFDHISLNYKGQTLNVQKSIVTESLKNVQLHLASFLLFLVLILWKKIRLNIIRSAVLSLVLFDLLINNFWINPLVRSELYDPAPAASFLAHKTSQESPARIYTFDQDLDKGQVILGETDSVAWVALYRKLTLFQFLAAKDHIQYSVFKPIDRLETLSSQAVRAELGEARGLDEKLRFLAALNVGFVISAKEIKSELLSLEGTFQVNSNHPLRIYRLVNMLPRAFLIDQAVSSELSHAGQTEYSTTPNSRTNRPALTDQRPGEARITNYSPSRVEIRASAGRACLLVLLDSNYPGWRTTVDGKSAEIQSFRQAFRAIPLQAGEHRIVFSYDPKSFHRGLSLSLFTACGWVLALIGNHVVPSQRKSQ
jgi:membrane protein YfhO